MRTRSFVFPPLLLVLALFMSNMTFAESFDVSLVQPAFAFSEMPAESSVVDKEDQIGLIQVVDSNIILSSALMESEDSFFEDDGLENGAFVNASPVSAKPLRSWSVPAPFPCESAACEPFACQGCGPPLPSACSSCDDYKYVDYELPAWFDRFALRNSKKQFFMSTWLSAGATIPARSPTYEVELPSRYPDIYNKFIMNQLYFTVGRNVNKHGNSIDIGGRLDLLYGTDYYFTSALGLETRTTDPTGSQAWNLNPKYAAARWNSSNGPRNMGHAALYGLSMPQLYGEFFAPLGLGTTVKAGHFYSIMGYESPMAPENFFYSHTWSMTHGGPMTFTGVVVSQQLTRRLSGHIGYTNGWDVWENPRGTGSVLTGFQWKSHDRSSELAFTLHTGNSRAADLGSPFSNGDRTNYSLVYSRLLSRRWKWAIQHDLGFEKNVNFIEDGRNNHLAPEIRYVDGQWASIVNYLYYTINDKWSVGGRFEWFQDTYGSRIATFMPYRSLWPDGLSQWTTGQNYYNFTMGLNWKPVPRMTLRPEIRWDWSDVERNFTYNGNFQSAESAGMFSNFRSKNLFTIGLEGYVKF